MDELKACLRCGAALQRGSIVGQQQYLNWEPAVKPQGPTMHGKQHLAKGSIARGPRLPAAICPSCGLGYFDGPATTG